MGLRDRMVELTTPEEVEEFLEDNPTCAIFKAGTCHKTMEGFAQVEAALDGYETINLGFIRVVEARPASNLIADLTGVQHQSPQILLFVDGEAVFDLDNWEVTKEALAPAAREAYGEPSGEGSADMPSDLSRYIELLHHFVIGEVDEESFRSQWLLYFQQDASMRSQVELDLLSSLFGDVDEALEGSLIRLGGQTEELRDRAGNLLEELLSLTEAVSP